MRKIHNAKHQHARYATASFAVIAPLVLLSTLAQATETKVAIKSGDGRDAGSVTVSETASGVLFRVAITGLPPGVHAFRLHDTGKCDGDFSSAGAIYNPLGSKHGLKNEDGPMAGDFPNIFASSGGEVNAEILMTTISLTKEGEETIFDDDGAALLVFANPDDHVSDPDGGAGAPIACGVLAAPKSK